MAGKVQKLTGTEQMDTTPIVWNKKVQKIRDTFDRILAITPYVKVLTLTPGMYNEYCKAILPTVVLQGNPKYRGVEIKKMGEA